MRGERNPSPGLSNVPYLHDKNSHIVQHSETLDLLREIFGKKTEEKYYVQAEVYPHSTKFRLETERARYIRRYYPPVAPRSAAKRGLIKELSEKSRNRLVSKCHELQSLGHKPDFMVTLTYPGDWQTVVPNGIILRRHIEAFRMRLTRYLEKRGLTFSALWFVEFQERGAPHLHLLMWGEGLKENSLKNMRSHVARGWAAIVNHPNKAEYEKHLKAGTSVSKMRAEHFGYASKYASKMEQKEVPAEFSNVGRFWGVWNYEKPVPITLNFEVKRSEYIDFAEGILSAIFYTVPVNQVLNNRFCTYRTNMLYAMKVDYETQLKNTALVTLAKDVEGKFFKRLRVLMGLTSIEKEKRPQPSFTVTIFGGLIAKFLCSNGDKVPVWKEEFEPKDLYKLSHEWSEQAEEVNDKIMRPHLLATFL